MSFLFKKKKKSADGKMSKETKTMYFTSEFKSLGDMTKDGKMNLSEFYRLMMLLQFPGDREGAKQLWKSRGKSDGGQMSLDEYIAMSMDKKVDSKTNTWRKLFAQFDLDGSGYASKAEVMDGLVKIGLPMGEELRKKVEHMDANNDGKISYEEFLKEQLKL